MVAQLGARQGYVVPVVLQTAGMLEGLYTDLCANGWGWRLLRRVWPRGLQPSAVRRLLGRRVEGIPAEKICSFPRFAWSYFWRRRRADTAGKLARFYAATNAEFGRRVVRRGFRMANTVYGYNGASLEIFEAARQRRLRTVLEQTSLPESFYQQLVHEECQRWPDWETGQTTVSDWETLAQRERAEWHLADLIVTGSGFARDAIVDHGGPGDRCVVVPYAAGPQFYAAAPRMPRQGPLRVLFVGAVRLYKGIPYLMQAAQRLGAEVVCRVVGPMLVSSAAERELRRHVELTGPVPRAEIRQMYDWADVFVLPSITEGSAVVCYEALAAGLPVITTPNAGSVVRDGLDGYVVPIRDVEALADRMARLAADRQLLGEMGASARARADEFTWQRYAERLLSALAS